MSQIRGYGSDAALTHSIAVNAQPTVLVPDGVTFAVYTNNASGWATEAVSFTWTGGTAGDIIQICENSSFRGSTLISKNADSAGAHSETLNRGAGRQYYWRIFAGGVSPSSEVKSFRLGWLKPNIVPWVTSPTTGQVTAADLITFNDPVFGKLIQANSLQSNHIIAANYDSADGSTFDKFGTPVEIQLQFSAVDGFDFTSWVTSPDIGDNLTYRLLNPDELETVADEYTVEIHDADDMWWWDAGTQIFNQVIFLVAKDTGDNASVGQGFVLETTVTFNSDLSPTAHTLVFKHNVLVQPLELKSSPYKLKVHEDLSDAALLAGGKYISFQGDLELNGRYLLFETSPELVVDTGAGHWSGSGLKAGMLIDDPTGLVGADTKYGWLVILQLTTVGIGTYNYEFYWLDRDIVQADIGTTGTGASPVLGLSNDIIAGKKICEAEWYGASVSVLKGIQFFSSDWLKVPDKTISDGEVRIAQDSTPVTSYIPVFGSDGEVADEVPLDDIPLAALGSHLHKTWAKLQSNNFEDNEYDVSDYPYSHANDWSLLIAGAVSGGVRAVTWGQTLGRDMLDPSGASVPTGSLLYYDGAKFVRLGQGSTGEVLTSQDTGGIPIWSAAGSGNVSGSGVTDEITVWSGTSTITNKTLEEILNSSVHIDTGNQDGTDKVGDPSTAFPKYLRKKSSGQWEIEDVIDEAVADQEILRARVTGGGAGVEIYGADFDMDDVIHKKVGDSPAKGTVIYHDGTDWRVLNTVAADKQRMVLQASADHPNVVPKWGWVETA